MKSKTIYNTITDIPPTFIYMFPLVLFVYIYKNKFLILSFVLVFLVLLKHSFFFFFIWKTIQCAGDYFPYLKYIIYRQCKKCSLILVIHRYNHTLSIIYLNFSSILQTELVKIVNFICF